MAIAGLCNKKETVHNHWVPSWFLNASKTGDSIKYRGQGWWRTRQGCRRACFLILPLILMCYFVKSKSHAEVIVQSISCSLITGGIRFGKSDVDPWLPIYTDILPSWKGVEGWIDWSGTWGRRFLLLPAAAHLRHNGWCLHFCDIMGDVCPHKWPIEMLCIASSTTLLAPRCPIFSCSSSYVLLWYFLGKTIP